MVCPVCTIAVGVGVGVLREFGVDDIITGLWYGALIVSSIAWMINWLNKKNIHFLFRKILVIIVFLAIFILPLYPMKVIGNPFNTVCGIDRLLFGVIIGAIIFILAVFSDKYLRKINEDKILIKYQKVLIPLIYLSIASLLTYLILKIACPA